MAGRWAQAPCPISTGDPPTALPHSKVISLLGTPAPNQSGTLWGPWASLSITSSVHRAPRDEEFRWTAARGLPGGWAPSPCKPPFYHLTSLRSPLKSHRLSEACPAHLL